MRVPRCVVVGPCVPEDGDDFHAGFQEPATGERRLAEKRRSIKVAYALRFARHIKCLGDFRMRDHRARKVAISVERLPRAPKLAWLCIEPGEQRLSSGEARLRYVGRERRRIE